MKNKKTLSIAVFAFFTYPVSLSAWTGWSSGTMLALSKAHDFMQSPVWVKEFPAAMVSDFAVTSGASGVRSGTRSDIAAVSGKRLGIATVSGTKSRTVQSGVMRSGVMRSGVMQSGVMQSGTQSGVSFQMGAFSYMRYIKENTASTAAISLGYKKSAFGLHYSYSGFSLYNEQQIGFSYGQGFGEHWNFGLGASYISYNKVEGLKGDKLLDISLSVICKISSSWKIYSLAEIPVTIFSQQKKTLSQRYYFKVGVGYNVIENLAVGIDITKDLRYPLQGAAGLSYLLAEHFLIYASTEIYPFVHTIGVGYLSKRWNIEWYGSYQTPIGFTTSVGVGWRITK
ncbi:MAG: hypothetical protein LBC49_00605 [Bacteroidales bacterium]|jgi:hypothetical protein|nr:hypothetical protein [Bacteroidales bacterium]